MLSLYFLLICTIFQGIKSEDDCTFSGVLTKKTLKKFPETNEDCYEFEGSITIDETTDLTKKEIENALELVSPTYVGFAGNITIKNTDFKNLSFFDKFLYYDNGGSSLTVVNNLKATEIYVPNTRVALRIENNPKLVITEANCKEIESQNFQDYTITGNKANCGCSLKDAATEEIISALPDDCTSISGNLTLVGNETATYDTLMTKLANVKSIYGNVQIIGTEYSDLNFLQSLQLISWINLDSYYYSSGTPPRVYVRIENNNKLETLGWPNFTKIEELIVSVRNNPSLCATPVEFAAFANSKWLGAADMKLCPETEPLVPPLARIPPEGFAGLPDGITVIVGDLNMNESTSLDKMWKLDYVTIILGNIIIENNPLKANNHLWKVKVVLPTEEPKIGVRITNNPNLKVIYFQPGMKCFGAIELGNNKQLVISEKNCNEMTKLNSLNVTENRGDCLPGKAPYYREPANHSDRKDALNILSTLLTVITFFYATKE